MTCPAPIWRCNQRAGRKLLILNRRFPRYSYKAIGGFIKIGLELDHGGRGECRAPGESWPHAGQGASEFIQRATSATDAITPLNPLAALKSQQCHTLQGKLEKIRIAGISLYITKPKYSGKYPLIGQAVMVVLLRL